MEFRNSFNTKIERKTRRTHKNSRDGCPNCKAKRIKCTEELPECSNCIKKKLRCGYKDFPEEKLEAIRKKNESKNAEVEPRDGYHKNMGNFNTLSGPVAVFSQNNNDPAHQDIYHAAYSNQIAPYSVVPTRDNSSIPIMTKSFVGSNIPNIPNGTDQVYEQFMLNDSPLNDEMKTQIISDVLNQTNQMKENYWMAKDDVSMFFFKELAENESHLPLHQLHGMCSKVDTHIKYQPPPDFRENYGGRNQGDNFTRNEWQRQTYEPVRETPSTYTPDYAVGSKAQSIIIRNRKNHDNEKSERNSSKMFDNAIIKKTRFKLFRYEAKRGKFFTHNRNNNRLKHVLSREFYIEYIPDWNDEVQTCFWLTVFNQASVFRAYYSFLIDRALNNILRYSSIDDVEGNMKEYLQERIFTTVLSQESMEKRKYTAPMKEMISNSNNMKAFTNKSYHKFGELLGEIRTCISNSQFEYAAKFSLLCAWSTFFSSNSTLKTCCIVYTGYSSLCSKILSEAESFEDISPSLRVSLDWINQYCTSSFIPDYPFNVIEELHNDFNRFKSFLSRSEQNIFRKNQKGSHHVENFISSIKCIQEFYTMDMFFSTLVNEIDPMIRKLNSTYKKLNHINDSSSNIYFASLNSFFELTVKIFFIYPFRVVNMKTDPLRKIFHLFFCSLIRALLNVYTPIRSLMLIDITNIATPNPDFDYDLYDIDTGEFSEEDAAFLKGLCVKLLRMVKFFNKRANIYGHYLSVFTTLDREFLKPVSDFSSEWNDVVQIKVEKLDSKEKFVNSFDEPISRNNYPSFDKDLNEKNSHDTNTIHSVEDLKCSQDWDPEPLVQLLSTARKQVLIQNKPSLAEMRSRFHVFDNIRKKLSGMVEHIA